MVVYLSSTLQFSLGSGYYAIPHNTRTKSLLEEIQVKPMDSKQDYTSIQVPTKVAGLVRNLTDIINHHFKKEQQLAQLLYKCTLNGRPVTQSVIGKELGVTREAIAMQYPKGGNK